MKSTVTFFKKNARHLFLLTTCLIMIGGITSCTTEKDEFEPQIALDDASLLASQMDNIIKTRASSTIVTMVTTAQSINFRVAHDNTDIHVNWGDGSVEMNTFSHIYTDSQPVHTIFLYGNSDAILHLQCQNSELIYLDISPLNSIISLWCNNNRLTTLDLTNNTTLEALLANNNRFTSVNFDYNPNLISFILSNNFIDSINLSHNSKLKSVGLNNNRLLSLDLSNNPVITSLSIESNNLTMLDFTDNPDIYIIRCTNNNIANILFSQASDLHIVDCSNNQLTSLSIPQPNNLTELICNDNAIANITIPSGAFADLLRLNITNNPFESDILSVITLSGALPSRTSGQAHLYTDPNAQWFSTLNATATAKGWLVN